MISSTSVDAEVQRMLDQVFGGLSNTLVLLTEKLGTDMRATLSYVFSGKELDLAGMSGEEMQKALSEYFSGIGDVAAEALFGDIIGQYRH
jgi:hypothetical protein